jgi:ketosteroid isomerase-like protein
MSNIKAVQAAQQALSQGNMEAFLGAISPECEWTTPEGGIVSGTFKGPDEILHKFFLPLAELSEFSLEVKENIESGDTVIAKTVYTIKARATGKTAQLDAVQVMTWKDGKMTKFRDHFDTHLARQAHQA